MLVKSAVRAEVTHVVSDADTATALACGDVAVLGTPRIVALCEAATVEALAPTLPEEHTSVGSRVEVAHLAPVAIGSTVTAVATLERCEGRRKIFSVSVTDASGLVAAGRVTRVVVERSQFLARAR